MDSIVIIRVFALLVKVIEGLTISYWDLFIDHLRSCLDLFVETIVKLGHSLLDETRRKIVTSPNIVTSPGELFLSLYGPVSHHG